MKNLSSLSLAESISIGLSKSLTDLSIIDAVTKGIPKFAWAGSTFNDIVKAASVPKSVNYSDGIQLAIAVNNAASIPTNMLAEYGGTLNYLSGMQLAISKNMAVYNQQLNLSEEIAKAFGKGLYKHLDTGIFNASNFIENKPLTPADIVSGSTFYKIFEEFNKDEDGAELQNAYHEIENLKEKEELLQQIVNLQYAVIASQNDPKKGGFKGLDHLIEVFYSKILMGKFKLSSKVAHLIIYIAFGIATLLIFGKDVVVDAKGGKIYDKAYEVLTGKKQPNKIDTVYIKNLPPILYPKTFTIKKAQMFRRDSVKTELIGRMRVNSEVSILTITNGWCYVEGIVTVTKKGTVKNREKYGVKEKKIEFEKITKGWVEKKNLDMFQ
jgi:hypothetical protein